VQVHILRLTRFGTVKLPVTFPGILIQKNPDVDRSKSKTPERCVNLLKQHAPYAAKMLGREHSVKTRPNRYYVFAVRE